MLIRLADVDGRGRSARGICDVRLQLTDRLAAACACAPTPMIGAPAALIFVTMSIIARVVVRYSMLLSVVQDQDRVRTVLLRPRRLGQSSAGAGPAERGVRRRGVGRRLVDGVDELCRVALAEGWILLHLGPLLGLRQAARGC